ncbi:MAG: TonB family protein [Flavobacteriaceae bacterium]|jgi:protein TonB|nr:TonB family protein [Flavobacteriaceae bacterium]
MAENQYKTLDDIVFENRNKTYGAYRLRNNQDGYLLKAFIIGTIIFLAAVFSMFLYNKWESSKGNGDYAINVDLTDLNTNRPKEEEKPQEIKEPEKIPPKQEETAQVKMVMPTPKKDNLVKVEAPPPTAKEAENKDLGTTNREGKLSTGAIGGGPVSEGPPVGPQVVEPPKDDNKVFDGNVDQEAQYPGGLDALTGFIGSNLEYPQEAIDNSTQGKVTVKFVVEKDGSVSNIQIVKDIGDGCGQEVVRILKKTKKWKAAMVNNAPVRSYYRLPVTFRLPD